jgi:hypothetical protein
MISADAELSRILREHRRLRARPAQLVQKG